MEKAKATVKNGKLAANKAKAEANGHKTDMELEVASLKAKHSDRVLLFGPSPGGVYTAYLDDAFAVVGVLSPAVQVVARPGRPAEANIPVEALPTHARALADAGLKLSTVTTSGGKQVVKVYTPPPAPKTAAAPSKPKEPAPKPPKGRPRQRGEN